MLRILLLNDDGIDSRRLQFAKKELEKIGTVWVVAPMTGKSGTSMSITIGDIPYKKISDNEYSVDGTPIDCYMFAKHVLKLDPNLIISGINYGFNLGFDTMYSGTYGVVRRATHDRVNSIAFSAGLRGSKMVEKWFLETVKYLVKYELIDAYYTANVNFPDDDVERFRGFRFVRNRLIDYRITGEIEDGVFRTKRKRLNEYELVEDTDMWAIQKGYIAITRTKLEWEM